MSKRSARMIKKSSSKKRSYKKRQYKKGGAKGGGLSESDHWNKEKVAGRSSRRQRSPNLSEEAKRGMRQRSPSPKKSSIVDRIKQYFGNK